MPTRLICPWNSPGKNTGMGSHSFLHGIFLTQRLNLDLLHCRQILYHLSHQRSHQKHTHIRVCVFLHMLLLFNCPVMSNSLWSHGPQHARPPCPSHLPEFSKFMSIASVMPSSHLIIWHPLLLLVLIFPASGDQNTGASASSSVFSMNIQGWFPLRLASLISLLSRTTVGRYQFFGTQTSLQSSSHNPTWPLGRP